ncbi:MAG: TPM domain-containing protein [Christensenellaceae bacterium]
MKSSKLKLASIILAVVLCLLVLSAPAGAVVQPNSDFYVLDNENVLSAETEKYIIDRNLNLVSNCKGAQVCVVVTDSTNGQDIEEYATELFNAWGIGSKTEDNGVLILFLTDDDNYWIMPGIGLERVLTERVLRQIIDDDCEPSFARKDYDSAAKTTFIAINQVVCNYYSQDPNGSGDSDNFPNNNGNNYYPDDHPDYNSGSSCLSCGSCLALSCAACGSCGSCSGGSFGGHCNHHRVCFQNHRFHRQRRRVPPSPRGGGFGGGFVPVLLVAVASAAVSAAVVSAAAAAVSAAAEQRRLRRHRGGGFGGGGGGARRRAGRR